MMATRRATVFAPAGLLGMVAMALATGCAGSWSAPGNGPAPASYSPLRDRPSAPAGGGQVEDSYTVLLKVFSTANHAEDAAYYKAQMERLAGWNDLFIAAGDEHSELYWGRYPTMQAAAERLKTAKAYRSPAGMTPFPTALVVPVPGSDIGPPEWNLLSAPGEYTVVVAVFYDVPDANYYGRKNHAVEYCRQLREQGRQAFYHHGPSQSNVTVGLFGSTAVRKVVTDRAIRLEIVAPRVQAIVKDFKHLAVNGYTEKRTVIDKATNRPKQVTAEPYLVEIPEKGRAAETP